MKPKKKKLKWHRSNAGIIKKLRQIAAAERKKLIDSVILDTFDDDAPVELRPSADYGGKKIKLDIVAWPTRHGYRVRML